jgi:hypothetical protein
VLRRPASPSLAQAETTRMRSASQGRLWRWIAIASATIIVVGALAVASLLFRQNGAASTLATETPGQTVLQATEIPTQTALPAAAVPTETPSPLPVVVVPTAMPSPLPPTLVPTETPVFIEPTLITIATTAAPLKVPPTTIPMVTAATSAQSSAFWQIQFVADGNNRFYVINMSAESLPPFPINDLQLSANGGEVVLSGGLWSILNLPSGACVALIRRDRDLREYDGCTLVSAIQVEGAYQFWRDDNDSFLIQYPTLGTIECGNDAARGAGCRVSIPA